MIVDALRSQGIFLDELAHIVGRDYDVFDLICHVAFDAPPLTRRERVDNVRKRHVFAQYGPQARQVLEALLDKYAETGIVDVEDPAVLRINPFALFGTPLEIARLFGGNEAYRTAIHTLQAALYQKAA